jgi:hypothetical protein
VANIIDKPTLLLECFSAEIQKRHNEAKHVGDLVAVDTFYIGVLIGVGLIYFGSAGDSHADMPESGYTSPNYW